MRHNKFWESHQPIYTGGKVKDEERLTTVNELTSIESGQGVAVEKREAT